MSLGKYTRSRTHSSLTQSSNQTILILTIFMILLPWVEKFEKIRYFESNLSTSRSRQFPGTFFLEKWLLTMACMILNCHKANWKMTKHSKNVKWMASKWQLEQFKTYSFYCFWHNVKHIYNTIVNIPEKSAVGWENSEESDQGLHKCKRLLKK